MTQTKTGELSPPNSILNTLMKVSFTQPGQRFFDFMKFMRPSKTEQSLRRDCENWMY